MAQILESGVLERVRQLSIQVHYNVNSTMNDCRENTKAVRAIEDYGFVRFSSRVNAFSENIHQAMNIETHLSYEVAWYNPYLKRSFLENDANKP